MVETLLRLEVVPNIERYIIGIPRRAAIRGGYNILFETYMGAPTLWFTAVLACVRSRLIRPATRIEAAHVDARWREHGEVDVVRHDPGIILNESTLHCNPFCVFVVGLVAQVFTDTQIRTITKTRSS